MRIGNEGMVFVELRVSQGWVGGGGRGRGGRCGGGRNSDIIRWGCFFYILLTHTILRCCGSDVHNSFEDDSKLFALRHSNALMTLPVIASFSLRLDKLHVVIEPSPHFHISRPVPPRCAVGLVVFENESAITTWLLCATSFTFLVVNGRVRHIPFLQPISILG